MLDLTHFLSLLAFIAVAGLGMAAIQDSTGKVLRQIFSCLHRQGNNKPAGISSSKILNRQPLHF